MGGAVALNWVVKGIVHRPRPAPFFGVDPASFSFPSGHVFFVSCFCGSLIMIVASARTLVIVLCGIFVLAVGWSRVYLGVHYPADVTGGLLAGTCWTGFVLPFTERKDIAGRFPEGDRGYFGDD